MFKKFKKIIWFIIHWRENPITEDGTFFIYDNKLFSIIDLDYEEHFDYDRQEYYNSIYVKANKLTIPQEDDKPILIREAKTLKEYYYLVFKIYSMIHILKPLRIKIVSQDCNKGTYSFIIDDKKRNISK